MYNDAHSNQPTNQVQERDQPRKTKCSQEPSGSASLAPTSKPWPSVAAHMHEYIMSDEVQLQDQVLQLPGAR